MGNVSQGCRRHGRSSWLRVVMVVQAVVNAGCCHGPASPWTAGALSGKTGGGGPRLSLNNIPLYGIVSMDVGRFCTDCSGGPVTATPSDLAGGNTSTLCEGAGHARKQGSGY